MVLSIVFSALCVLFFVLSMCWAYFPNSLSCWILPICMVLAVLFFFLSLIFVPPTLCPECHLQIDSDMHYCAACGYELIPHCIDCGEICRTAFCALCGAEQ